MAEIAIPPHPASPIGATIGCGTFWPAIDLNAFRDMMRVGKSIIPDARLVPALKAAAFTAMNDLDAWRLTKEAEGYPTLADVPSLAIEDETRLTLLWQRAVFSYATADLTETHPDLTVTAAGAGKSEVLALSVDDHRANGLRAIRDILGVGRVTAELI